MSTAHNVTAARAEAEAAKQRLLSTVHEIQYRLKPSTLAGEAWGGVKDRGNDAVTAVKDRPQAAGAVAAVLVLLFARKPLMDLVARLFGRQDDDHLTTDLGTAEGHVDLKAPVVPKQPKAKTGVTA